MRIAVYHNLLSGGAKRALHAITQRLVRDHEVRVYSLESANHAFADLRPLVARHRVFAYRPLGLFRSPFGRLNQLVRLADLRRIEQVARQAAAAIEADGADVAFVHPCQVENSPSVLSYLRRVPSVYYCQEPLRRLYEPAPERPYATGGRLRRALDRLDPFPRLYHRALKQVDRRNLGRAGRVLVNSQFVREAVRQIYGRAAQVAYLGVDAEFFRPLGLSRLPVFLSVGSLTPLKGFDFLIRAIGRLPRPQRWPLVLASNFQNAPERDYLTGLAERAGVDLRLEGNVTDERLREWYNQATMTVYAPWREPFGLVPIESLACATPVVAVREGGVPESVIHEQVGLLAERDEAGFAQQLAALAADPARAAALGLAGRQQVLERWTWEHAVASLTGHLKDAIEGERDEL